MDLKVFNVSEESHVSLDQSFLDKPYSALILPRITAYIFCNLSPKCRHRNFDMCQ